MKSIVQNGDAVLRTPATPVTPEDFSSGALAVLVREMTDILDKEDDGVALAAPQIGVGKRVFIVRYDRTVPPPKEGEPPPEASVGVYINPEITKTSRKKVRMDEGCLSVRGTYGTTERYERATVRAQDSEGKWFTRGGGGVLAQAFQHEIDHLNGILFIDHAKNFYEHSHAT